jgi:hypothetical protein
MNTAIDEANPSERQDEEALARYIPKEILPLKNPQTNIPRIAKDGTLVRLVEEAVRHIPTNHTLKLGDARSTSVLEGYSFPCDQ